MPDNSALTKDPWYAKPSIRRMVEGSNGYTVFDDRQVPNRTRDPYAPSRDFTYYMQYVLHLQKKIYLGLLLLEIMKHILELNMNL